LREKLFLTGTKEVCCEGDCGACTVIWGKFTNGKLNYKPVNSCILYVYQLHNTHIITVEGLKYGEKLNPVQISIAENHGTQCGFCTPGFVNTLYSYFDTMNPSEKVEEKQVKKALTGNLCRCTGYEGIIRSALDVKPCEVKTLNELYPPETLKYLLKEETETIEISNEKQKYIKPVSLQEAVEHKSKNQNARIIAGGTDLHVLTNKKDVTFAEIIDISGLQELGNINITNDFISIGAAITIAEAESVFKEHFFEFYNLLEYYASPQIKNIATFAGNIANASPVGDSIPFLMVTNSEIEVFGLSGKRTISLTNLFKGYKTLDLSPDEIITNIKIPLLKENEILKLYKVSNRKHLDISTFSAAFKIKLENNKISDFAMALGGVAACTTRMYKIEEFIKGKNLAKDLFITAGKIISQEIIPISDVRGSNEYRINLAKNILLKFYNELNQKEGEKCLH
jgi:xanthine dehydrogenase small subunit